MPLDASIYGSVQPRSVADYADEYDRRDLRQIQLAGAQRQNELAALNAQQTQQSMARNLLVQAAQRQAAQQAGGDEGVYAKNLRLSGMPELIDPADKIDKSRMDRLKLTSENAKRDIETENARLAQWKDYIGLARDPEQAAVLLQAMHTDPALQNTAIAKVPFEQGLMMLQSMPFEQWKQQFSLGAQKFIEMNKPTYQQQNLGGTMQTLQLPGMGGAPSVVASAPITQSADNRASVAATMRGQDMIDARTRETNEIQRAAQRTQVVDTPNGPLLVDKGTGQGRPVIAGDGKPVPGDSTMKRESGARRVLSLLDQAEKLIPEATGSYAGAAADTAARVVGAAPGGAQAIAKLKALEGSLLAEMPRMEGPQSNADVVMYKQAAGELGDPTAPRANKMAAIQTIREIQSRNAGVQAPKREGGATGTFSDPEKERRYQEWKRQQGQ